MEARNFSVFIVDDDNIVRFIHKKVIESFSKVKVLYNEAINGREAILALKNSSIRGDRLPDVILLDINMPILDGFGFIEEFQKSDLPHKEKTEIIIVSSSENPKDKQRCVDLGIKRFLPKPMTKDKFESAIFENVFS